VQVIPKPLADENVLYLAETLSPVLVNCTSSSQRKVGSPGELKYKLGLKMAVDFLAKPVKQPDYKTINY